MSDPHAFRNHIHGIFPAELFRGWNCWREELAGKQVVGFFGSLAMGTSFAVEVAQHTPRFLLKRAGCLKDEQWVQYKNQLPSGDTLQLFCIDDYAVLHKVPVSKSACTTSKIRLNAQWRKFSHQPLSHSATLAEWLTQPLSHSVTQSG